MSKKIHFLLFFFLCLASIPLVAQNIEVKGVVTEATTNEPLPGVTVKVKGKDTGTVTNMDGKYTVKANKGDILVFSTIGMKSIEHTISSNAPINVSMEEDNVALEQVVVIGYGTAKKSHLSGAVSSVGAKELNGAVATNAGTALQGKIAGVSVTSTSGDPNEGMTINVRGISSLSSNDPLYVIDGSFGDLSMVDPSDIASIEVLKDAAAAAIYGSRAAGGVVLVTTKSGRKDMPTKLEVNFFTGIQAENKISWLGQKGELKSFIDFLLSLGKIENCQSNKWQITAANFKYVNEDFTPKKIKDGDKAKNDIKIKQIVQKIN
jgi:TonB-dependent SusC/RagA subfamily outer membrane receptor